MTGNKLIAAIIALVAIAALSAIVLVACTSPAPRSTTAQQNLNSAQVQATNVALSDQAEAQATESAQKRAADQAMRATDRAVSATEQARQDAAAQLSIEQQQIAATATRRALDRQMQIDAQDATKIAVEARATITATNNALLLIEQNQSRKNDLWYILPDYLMRYAPCGAIILSFLLMWYLVRAIASRIAGDEGRARMALESPSLTFYLPTALLPAPRDDDGENSGETGNTATAENAGNTEETGRETPDLIDLGYSGDHHLSPRMSREEYHELISIRQEAIALLDRCVKYYRESQSADDGTIPRYDKIHMKSEDRGRIVDNLWYSQFVIKSPNKTVIDPALYQTCAALMQAIIDKRARVYPMGYVERKQQRLDDAIAALPGIDR